MEHLKNKIAEFNIIKEKLVRLTYLKTVYSCPSDLERENDPHAYDDEDHHQYRVDRIVVILSVYEKERENWDWKDTLKYSITQGKIEKTMLNSIDNDISRDGVFTETHNPAIYDTEHWGMAILSVEHLN